MNGKIFSNQIIYIFLILLIFNTFACANDKKIYFHTSLKDNYSYEHYVTEGALLKMPSWAPTDGTPPITQTEAIKIAKKYISETDPIFLNAEISGVQLTQFLIPNFYKNKWYYKIIFMTNIPVTNNPPEISFVFVLMDGSIPKFKKTKTIVDEAFLKRIRDNLDKKIKE